MILRVFIFCVLLPSTVVLADVPCVPLPYFKLKNGITLYISNKAEVLKILGKPAIESQAKSEDDGGIYTFSKLIFKELEVQVARDKVSYVKSSNGQICTFNDICPGQHIAEVKKKIRNLKVGIGIDKVWLCETGSDNFMTLKFNKEDKLEYFDFNLPEGI